LFGVVGQFGGGDEEGVGVGHCGCWSLLGLFATPEMGGVVAV
jgi:hypothetical protein